MKSDLNAIETWNISYKHLKTTYSEELNTLGSIVDYVQFQFVYEDILKYLVGTKNPRILEVGCGGARVSLFLALHGFDVSCTDTSSEALRLAKNNFASNNAKGMIFKDDLLNSELRTESFDCVMSFGLLEHFTDIDAPIRAASRLLKQGGIHIHCVVPKKFSTESIMNVLLYPLRFLEHARRRDFRNIFSRSFRDFPHYENSFTARYYSDVFAKEGNEMLRCEAGGVLSQFFNLPYGASDFIARHFSRHLVWLSRATDRSQSRLMHLLAPCFYIVARKKRARHFFQ